MLVSNLLQKLPFFKRTTEILLILRSHICSTKDNLNVSCTQTHGTDPLVGSTETLDNYIYQVWITLPIN